MAAEFMIQLEAAAKVMLAPPSVITSEQRHAAEQVFMNFRLSKTPYTLCKQILETCTVDYVLFETASTLKDALVREWKYLPEAEVNELRQFLFDYVVQKPTLRPFVRERILQVIAIMIKRHSVQDFGHERRKLLEEVQRLIMEGDLPRQMLGCSIISAVIQEYSNSVKSSDIGLVWEDHFQLKKDFELTDLRKTLQLAVNALTEIAKLPLPFTESAQTLAKSLLAICETVLNWNFTPTATPGNKYPRLYKKMMGMLERSCEAERSPSLKLSSQWKDFILDPNIINLFFEIYWKIRDNPHLAHHALSCLGQLASLSGPTVSSKEHRTAYFTNYIESFIKLVTSIEIRDWEALGMSNIIYNIMTYCPPTVFVSCFSAELVQNFLQQFTRLTIYFAQGAAHEESVQADDHLFMEAFENLMKVWLTVLSDSSHFSEDFCNQASVEVFNTYLKCHLSPPDGSRGSWREVDAEEIEENDEIDQVKFKLQLIAVGVLGRQVPSHSIPLLYKLLEMKIMALHSNLERIHCNSFSISDSTVLGTLFEDIHWLLLISGHVVAMESKGETALVPTEIMEFSNNQQADDNATLQVLASVVDPNSVSSSQLDSADHVVRLIVTVLKLCEIEKKVVEANMSHLLSPLVSSTLMWFLRHWSYSYLLPNESYYFNLSAALKSSFGINSGGALWTVNFLLSKIESNLRAFSSEPSIVEGSVDLLVALLDMREKANFILKSEGFWRLVEQYRELDTRHLPSPAKRGLMKAFTLGAAGIEDASERENYWVRILKPVAEKLKSLVGDERFKTTYQDEAVRMVIIDVLESFIGVSQGAQVVTVHAVFAYTHPVLSECSQLISLYCNYQVIVELILDFFVKCSRSFSCFLTATESKKFYQCCLNVIQMYAKSNRGKRTVDASAEEDAFNDIYLLMELFSCLQSKDVCDLSPPDNSNDSGPQLSASDVCLYGLRILMPLMTVDLLKFPSLCLQYYRMVVFVCELFPEKMLTLDDELLNSILSTIQMGLHSFGKEVACMCCSFIQALGTHVFNAGQQSSFRALAPFVGFLVDLILCRQVNSDVMYSCGSALFILMCCYLEEYHAAVQRWIGSQTDPIVAERLAKAFESLTADIQPNLRHKSDFQTALNQFVVDVHGFLLVK